MSDSVSDILPMKGNKMTANSMLYGFDRSPAEQASENLRQALRVLELIPMAASDLTPHPLVVVRAEIENARRYLGISDTARISSRSRPPSRDRDWSNTSRRARPRCENQ